MCENTFWNYDVALEHALVWANAALDRMRPVAPLRL